MVITSIQVKHTYNSYPKIILLLSQIQIAYTRTSRIAFMVKTARYIHRTSKKVTDLQYITHIMTCPYMNKGWSISGDA